MKAVTTRCITSAGRTGPGIIIRRRALRRDVIKQAGTFLNGSAKLAFTPSTKIAVKNELLYYLTGLNLSA